MATILVVDDRPTNRQFLVTLLGYSGHRLLEAADGKEALYVVRARHPDLVIADILMPTMDGYEFVRQLRADPDIAQTTVMFYTAHYREREAQALAQSCGVPYILTKPSEPETILRVVNEALGFTTPTVPSLETEEFDREHLRLLTDKLSQKADELRAVNLRLNALTEINLHLASELNPDRLLEKFCHAARDLISAKYAVVGVMDKDGKTFRQVFTSGMEAKMAASVGASHINLQENFNTVFQEHNSFRMRARDIEQKKIKFPLGLAPTHSLLGAPIVSPSKFYGWLFLQDKIGAENFSDEDERLASILAAQVGRIYENGNFYNEIQQHAGNLEREVAERKLIEKALRESEDRYRTVAETASDAIITIDRDSRMLFVNPAAEKIFGYTTEEMMDQPLTMLMPNYLRPIHRAGIKRYIETGHKHIPWNGVELPGLHKSGQEIPLEISFGEFHKNGKHFFTGIVRDITERKKAEQRLKEAEGKYRGIFENAVEGIFQSAPDGRFIAVNPAMAEMLGYESPEEMMALRQDTENEHYVNPDCRAKLQQTLAEHSVAMGFECEIYRKDLSSIWAIENVRAIRDEQSELLYYEGSVVDISERKKLEDQLRQAQRMEAVGRLAGGIAHDFNNLLTVISMHSDIMLQSIETDDPLRHRIEEVGKAGARASALTRQLLAFSRKQILQPRVIDLNTIVTDMEKMLNRIIGEDIELQTILQSKIGHIKADPGQIEQVIMNLAINARDAMPNGGKLTIETKNIYLDEAYARNHIAVFPGPYVMLAISDTGCGMDQETLTHIFEPFFTTKEVGKGTGLGLSTVYGIVKQSGGNIWVYSEPMLGTTFKIYLPRVDEEVAELRRTASRIEFQQGTETILLVEDEASVRKLAREVLEMNGYKVLEAAEGETALLLCEQHQEPIHLLLTDVVMPEISGRELSKRLAGIHPEMRVLYMSGYTDDAIVHHGTLDHGTNFIQKPFSPVALVKKVRECLDEPI